MPTDEQVCKTCWYWNNCDMDEVVTDCCRHAPVVQDDSAHPVWPRTMFNAWCGDWAAVTEAPNAD